MKYNRPSWDIYFITQCYLIASRSIDQSTHAGSVIVTQHNTIVSTGYNGPVRSEEFTVNDPRHNAPEKYKWMEHSERNAIYNAARHGIKLEGCRLYVNFCPCVDCARAIVQSGIIEVIIHKEGHDAFLRSRDGNTTWDDSFKTTLEMLGDRIRWCPGKLWMPTGFFSGQEYTVDELV